MSTESKAALWHRLRNDPDFTPEWLRFMGQAPPTDADHRTWGDGATSTAPHVIEDISFAERWVVCRCGAVVGDDGVALEDAWDTHRGRSDLVIARATTPYSPHDLANDADVADFLKQVATPSFRFTP